MKLILPKPAFGTPLNQGHWSTKGLAFYSQFRPARTLIDETTNKNHGPISGATWVGGGLDFDGNDFVNLGVQEVGGTRLFAASPNQFTVTTCLKVSSGNSGTIVSRATSTAADRIFQMAIISDAQILINLRGTENLPAVSLADGLYHTFSVVFDGVSGRSEYYIDGTKGGDLNVGSTADDTQNIVFGARTGGVAFFLTGQMTDIKIYNRALTANEMNQLYRNPALPFQTYTPTGFVAVAGPAGGQVINVQFSKLLRRTLVPVMWMNQGKGDRRGFMKNTLSAIIGIK
jgi:hypothetical protein